MSLGTEIAVLLPYLRRHARALTGSQPAGDALVRATLEAALADAGLAASLHGGRVPLYRAFTQVWANARVHEPRAASASRQALLLTTLEDFSAADVAAIMGLPPAEITTLVDKALAELAREERAEVLIIEDEPLIAMQLCELVGELGHTVCGTVATRSQALAAALLHPPGLVLADIQLADGSSGMDAVDDILTSVRVPVIFITAFPERLLTGEGREPTWLITKPFQDATVKAAISQALYFGANAVAA